MSIQYYKRKQAPVSSESVGQIESNELEYSQEDFWIIWMTGFPSEKENKLQVRESKDSGS